MAKITSGENRQQEIKNFLLGAILRPLQNSLQSFYFKAVSHLESNNSQLTNYVIIPNK